MFILPLAAIMEKAVLLLVVMVMKSGEGVCVPPAADNLESVDTIVIGTVVSVIRPK